MLLFAFLLERLLMDFFCLVTEPTLVATFLAFLVVGDVEVLIEIVFILDEEIHELSNRTRVT